MPSSPPFQRLGRQPHSNKRVECKAHGQKEISSCESTVERLEEKGYLRRTRFPEEAGHKTKFQKIVK